MGLFDVGGGGFTAEGDPFGDQIRKFGANTGAPVGGTYDEEVRARAKSMRMGSVPGGTPVGTTVTPPPVGTATPSTGVLRRLLGGVSRLFTPVATGVSAGLAGYEAGQAGVEAIADASLRASNRLGPAGVEFLRSGQYDARPETIQATGLGTPAKFGAEIQDAADAKVRGLQEQTAARTARVNEVIAASQAARGADAVTAEREASPAFPRGPSSYGDAFRFLIDLGRYKAAVKDQNEAITERRLQESARSKLLVERAKAGVKQIPIESTTGKGAVVGDTYIRPDPKDPSKLLTSKVPAATEDRLRPGLDAAMVKAEALAAAKKDPSKKAGINAALKANNYDFQI